ncbi:MAG TPA: lipoate--protein ligase family protein [Candidatus Omnitrophota bacterium]|nr:lipoate--protein ligase family protein [Candidatus Omnitrophota bacterium]
MLLKDVSFPSPEENILYDEVLLHLAEQGKSGGVLRFWESPETFIVLGRIGKEQDDIKIDAARKDRVPVLRRASGGGTVVQGKGCLNYSLVLPKPPGSPLADLRGSYAYILGKVIAALKMLDVETVFCPISDIALAESLRKVSGNAQKRGRHFFLHHGTILYDFDLTAMERYLHLPKDIPEYRRGRTHPEFVANIPRAVADIKNALSDVFGVDRRECDLDTDERDGLKAFLSRRNAAVKLVA